MWTQKKTGTTIYMHGWNFQQNRAGNFPKFVSCYITKGKRQMQEKGSALLKGNWDIKYMYKMLNQTTRLLDWSLHQAEESYLW